MKLSAKVIVYMLSFTAITAQAQEYGENTPNCGKPTESLTYEQRNYAREVFDKILPIVADKSENWVRDEKEAGKAGCITFFISETGQVNKATVFKSSGSQKSDRLALQAVNTVSPLPPPPTKVINGKTEIHLVFNFKFSSNKITTKKKLDKSNDDENNLEEYESFTKYTIMKE